jgi:predicted O-linked N-acetylglucosamine transferase (SPINDLY family)
MGVPVVTLLGRRHSGRMTASVLTCMGLEDLAAETPEEYVSIAALAADRGRRAELQATLRQRLLASPLCDGERFTRGLEQACQGLVQQSRG